eukprot:TRINITY_DN3261_c0_g5_i1.p1 TRINITY_DN3261_c0_g5~~TRINITY_DN3261_c0_g5_i1.p1  ORF type:complete len:497 (-),score=83.85 TRINITY_DN3261_c0_g5_i1:107-1597(-)
MSIHGGLSRQSSGSTFEALLGSGGASAGMGAFDDVSAKRGQAACNGSDGGPAPKRPRAKMLLRQPSNGDVAGIPPRLQQGLPDGVNFAAPGSGTAVGSRASPPSDASGGGGSVASTSLPAHSNDVERPGVRRTARQLLEGCRLVDRFRKLNRIDEGTYGVVYRARDTVTGEVVALKQLKLSASKSEEGFPHASLREVILLSKMDHPNVVCLREVVVGSSPLHIFMVMDYAEHELRALLEHTAFGVAEVKCLMKQLLSAVAHLHERWVLHRDLKTSNLLLTNQGVLKVCDFGLARHFGSPLRNYSKNVITLWYRAPELILGQRQYSTGVDVWSVGCIFAEMFLRRPLLPGKSEIHQLTLIFELTGTPTEEEWPGYEALPNRKHLDMKLSMPRWRTVFPEPPEGSLSDMGLELLRSLLTCSPERRASAEGAGEDPYFWERPYALEPGMMPTFQDTNTTARVEKRPVQQTLVRKVSHGKVAAAPLPLLEQIGRHRSGPF